MNIKRVTGVMFAVLGASGCAGVPELPTEANLPIADISDEAVCQVFEAFTDLFKDGASTTFDPKNWTIGISLTPKTTTDFQIGLTGSGTNNPKPGGGSSGAKSSSASGSDTHLPTWTWAIAPTSGAFVDRTGDSTGVVSYTLHSSVFYSDQLHTVEAKKKAELLKKYCKNRDSLDERSNVRNFIALSSDIGPNPHNSDLAIRGSLGIENWLFRIVQPANDGILSLVSNQPSTSPSKSAVFSYTTHLSVTVDGGASASWSPPGAALHLIGLAPAATAKRNEDVILGISFVHDTPSDGGGEAKSGSAARAAVHQFGNDQQLRQIIQQFVQ